jgi:hypothetical protein
MPRKSSFISDWLFASSRRMSSRCELMPIFGYRVVLLSNIICIVDRNVSEQNTDFFTC